jgi:arsenate reductase
LPLTIYHNAKCGKSRETLKLLQDRGLSPTIVDYLRTPPDSAELKRILQLLGMPAKDLLRRKEAREAGIDPDLPEDALIAAMIAHPIVIERPIVVANGKARIGRPPQQVLEIL